MGPHLTGWLTFPSVQIALCVGVYAAVCYWLGPFAMVWTSPLLGAAVARPVMSLLANIRHTARENVWLSVHGHHYVFKGITVHVLEDEDRHRWICLADVRKLVAVTASHNALALAYPDRVKTMGKPAQAHLRDDALIELLAKDADPTGLRLRTWVERNIAFSGRRIRKSLGIGTGDGPSTEG